MRIDINLADTRLDSKGNRENHEYNIYIDRVKLFEAPCFSIDNPLKIYGEHKRSIQLEAGDQVYKEGKLIFEIKNITKSYRSMQRAIGRG